MSRTRFIRCDDDGNPIYETEEVLPDGGFRVNTTHICAYCDAKDATIRCCKDDEIFCDNCRLNSPFIAGKYRCCYCY